MNGCVSALAPLLDRPCLVVGKSTLPVGTARRLAAELARTCAEAELAWNPEFLREGTAVADSLSPDRIVAGVTSSWAEGILRQVYTRPIADGSLFITAGLETAELAKVAANAFLATKFSFINAMAREDAGRGSPRRAHRAAAHRMGRIRRPHARRLGSRCGPAEHGGRAERPRPRPMAHGRMELPGTRRDPTSTTLDPFAIKPGKNTPYRQRHRYTRYRYVRPGNLLRLRKLPTRQGDAG